MTLKKLVFEVFTNDSIEAKHHVADSLKGFCAKNVSFTDFDLQVQNLTEAPELAVQRNIVILPALDITENGHTTRIIGTLENMMSVILACAQRHACFRMADEAQKMVEATQKMLNDQR